MLCTQPDGSYEENNNIWKNKKKKISELSQYSSLTLVPGGDR